MKNHIIISLLFLSVGLSQKEYDINHIVLQNGVYIKKFSDEIVNGKVFQMGGDMKVPLGKMKDGKKEGKWMVWYDNGTKQREQNYKDGKGNGLSILWYENGQKMLEGTKKDGKEDGKWTVWDENGHKNEEIIFKDGKMNGLYTSWYDDGKKSSEGTYKDMKENGLWDSWYENGQKKYEKTYKDGELISLKEWNEDGSVKGGKEKKQKKETSTEKKTIYEQKPFRVSYITHNYGDDIEVEFILNNMGNKPYSSVWFNFSFYNGDKMVGKERISFLSLGVFSEEIEIIDFDDEFDKIEVELLKFKLK